MYRTRLNINTKIIKLNTDMLMEFKGKHGDIQADNPNEYE